MTEYYRVHCIFCTREHICEFWDDLEMEIMRCRENSPEHKRGNLSDFQGDTCPIRPEVSAYMGGCEDMATEIVTSFI